MPDVSGRWKGSLRSSYIENGHNVSIPIVFEITQKFSGISVHSYTETSESISNCDVACVQRTDDEYYLIYTYENSPNTYGAGTMQRHGGTAKLKLLEKARQLRGTYFNDLGNKGDLSLDFESPTLLRRYS
jgi:hypothetical protein